MENSLLLSFRTLGISRLAAAEVPLHKKRILRQHLQNFSMPVRILSRTVSWLVVPLFRFNAVRSLLGLASFVLIFFCALLFALGGTAVGVLSERDLLKAVLCLLAGLFAGAGGIFLLSLYDRGVFAKWTAFPAAKEPDLSALPNSFKLNLCRNAFLRLHPDGQVKYEILEFTQDLIMYLGLNGQWEAVAPGNKPAPGG